MFKKYSEACWSVSVDTGRGVGDPLVRISPNSLLIAWGYEKTLHPGKEKHMLGSGGRDKCVAFNTTEVVPSC